MSFIGTLVIACLHPSEVPSRLVSMNDIASLKFDDATSVYTFSRNGWLNNRLEELASHGYIKQLPTNQSPAVVLDSKGLGAFIADIKLFLELLAREPRLLPEVVLAHVDEAELSRTVGLAPVSLKAALSALAAAKSRDEEAESIETLVCHLWFQLRLAEHAVANGMNLICVRSQ